MPLRRSVYRRCANLLVKSARSRGVLGKGASKVLENCIPILNLKDGF